MEANTNRSFIVSYRYVLASLCLGLGYWLIAAAIAEASADGQAGLLSRLLPPSPHALFTRFFTVFLILLCGSYVQRFANQYRRLKNQMRMSGVEVPEEDAYTRLIIENTSSMIGVLDKDARYIYSSPSNTKFLGYTPKDLQGQSGLSLVHPDDQQKLADLLGEALAGEIDSVFAVDYRLIDKTGEYHYLSGTFDVIRDEQGNVEKIVVLADDITEKITIEKALKESEQRLRMILNTAPVAIAEIDCQGLYQFINPGYSKIFGYTVEEMKTMSVKDLTVSKQDGEDLLALLSRLTREQPPPSPWEGRNRTKSGEIMDIVVHWDYKRDAEGLVTGFLTVINDVTDQKLTAAALQASQQRYQAMFDHIHSGVAVYQAVDDGQDFVVLDFNQTAEKIEVISREKVVGKKVTEVFPGVTSLGLFDVLRRVYKTGQPEHHPVNLYKDDRIAGWRENYVYKLFTGEVVSVYSDESANMEAREALRESEARFRALVEYSTDHIFMLAKDGRYLFSNGRLENMECFDLEGNESLLNKNLGDLYPRDIADRYHRILARVFKEAAVISFEYEIKGRNTNYFYLDTLYPVYKDGDIWAAGGICRDITTHKRFEKELQQKTRALESALQELRQTQRRLIDQERQRALSQMASGIAHDFNNSLSTMQGFSDLLLQSSEKLNDRETVKRYLTLINNASKDAAQIVRRLRKFYRPGDDELIETVDLNALIEEAVSSTTPLWKDEAQARGASITVEKNLDHQVKVSGNATELHDVITNLICNAVDAMPQGGTLRFYTRHDGDEIVLEVHDTGIGMDADVRRQCLTPFYTTKGEAGSGLGLPTVQGIITRHRGRLDIHSTPGQGTAFLIRLPTILSKSTPLQPGAVVTDHNGGTLRILVVDDEADQRLLLKEYLQKENHRVETAVNGIDGIQKFGNGWYDLVITDRAMPELNGDALARHVKRISPGKPIIMLTGFGDMMDAAGEKPEAVDMVIAKPFSLKELRQAIHQTCHMEMVTREE